MSGRRLPANKGDAQCQEAHTRRKQWGNLLTLREKVEDFLYQEAALLDEWRLDEWLALFSPRMRGVWSQPQTFRKGTQKRSWCSSTMTSYVCELGWKDSKAATATENILGLAPAASLAVSASSVLDELNMARDFVLPRVYRFRMGDTSPYVGWYEHRLKEADGQLKISQKKAVLDMEALREHGAVEHHPVVNRLRRLVVLIFNRV